MWWANKAWHNKLFRAGAADGSYDFDIFTQTTEQYYAKCARGQYMGMHSVRDDLYRESVKTDPETLAGYATVPTAAANLSFEGTIRVSAGRTAANPLKEPYAAFDVLRYEGAAPDVSAFRLRDLWAENDRHSGRPCMDRFSIWGMRRRGKKTLVSIRVL